MEETFCLGKVDDVDFDRSFEGVSHTEHEPLELSLTVGIVAHPHIKDFRVSLSNLIEIGTLKRCVEGHLRLA